MLILICKSKITPGLQLWRPGTKESCHVVPAWGPKPGPRGPPSLFRGLALRLSLPKLCHFPRISLCPIPNNTYVSLSLAFCLGFPKDRIQSEMAFEEGDLVPGSCSSSLGEERPDLKRQPDIQTWLFWNAATIQMSGPLSSQAAVNFKKDARNEVSGLSAQF